MNDKILLVDDERDRNVQANTAVFVLQIIELHGGNIFMESELGKGTSVTIDFPL